MKTKKCLLVYLFCLVLLITQSSRVPVAKAATPTVLYYVAMDNSKVQAKKKNGQTAGYATKDKQIEAIWIKLSGTGYSGSVRYRSYVQVNGWKKWEKDGAMSGSKGKNRRLEAIEIKLTGEVAKHYDIYYRVYAKSYGWLGWAKNGEKAGTTGQGQKLRGIQIRLVEKDGTPPMDGNESAYKQFSMSKLLKTSIQPVGSTMYIYGGAWNEADDGAGVEAVTMGLSPRWAEYAAMQNASYNYRNTRYQIHDGLDCSGYVGWVMDGANICHTIPVDGSRVTSAVWMNMFGFALEAVRMAVYCSYTQVRREYESAEPDLQMARIVRQLHWHRRSCRPITRSGMQNIRDAR